MSGAYAPRAGEALIIWRTVVALSVVVALLVACANQSLKSFAPTVEALPSGSAPEGLENADSSLPAAGICDPQPGSVATFTLAVDTPQPRCGRVSADQRLRVVNRTATAVTVIFQGTQYVFDSGAGRTFTPTFGSIWEPGVHDLHTSLYGVGGPEIWLASR